jgi:hypothetical protein
MKTKGDEEIIKGLTNIITKNDIKPTLIISDSDSSFLSNNFNKFLNKYDILHDTVILNDHHALGVIDRFALTIKTILSKRREYLKDANWKDNLKKVIDKYNNTEHNGILDLTPNEANEKEFYDILREYNLDKSKANNMKSDLEKGDKVRINESKIFKKGSEPQWSSKIYIVESARGKTIYLNNGDKKKRNMLLKIPNDTKENISITKKITKEKKIERINKQEGINEKNIIIGKRIRK